MKRRYRLPLDDWRIKLRLQNAVPPVYGITAISLVNIIYYRLFPFYNRKRPRILSSVHPNERRSTHRKLSPHELFEYIKLLMQNATNPLHGIVAFLYFTRLYENEANSELIGLPRCRSPPPLSDFPKKIR